MDYIDTVAYLWIVVFLFLIIGFYRRSVIKKVISRRKNRKNTERKRVMNELLNSCIGKMCDIYIYGELGTTARIVSVSDGWVAVEKKNGKKDMVNLDYISRISVKDKD